MEYKVNVRNYIHTIRSYLKREESENSDVSGAPISSQIQAAFTSPSTGVEFMEIPAGEFEMGTPSNEMDSSESESPVHKVTIKNAFLLGKTPVTQEQWEKIMGNNPSRFKGRDRPVEMVSWHEVQQFIEKINEKESTSKYRLPSEAEWEYACRAGTQTRYFFGNNTSKLKEYAWYVENSGTKTHPVARKNPNPWGLFDIHGNVWEWVSDKFHENYLGAPSDGTSWQDADIPDIVSRGGSWYCTPDFCRSASRFKRKPDNNLGNLGFRVLREL